MFDLAQIAFDRDAAGKQSLFASQFKIVPVSQPKRQIAGQLVWSRFAPVLRERHTGRIQQTVPRGVADFTATSYRLKDKTYIGIDFTDGRNQGILDKVKQEWSIL